MVVPLNGNSANLVVIHNRTAKRTDRILTVVVRRRLLFTDGVLLVDIELGEEVGPVFRRLRFRNLDVV